MMVNLPSITERIANELNVKQGQIDAAVGLLDEGATVPFISRYRKEVTGGLDDIQMRALEERLRYMRELEDRRQAVLKSVTEQGKLDDVLARQIALADTKNRLEDLYLPYKPKRRTKAQIAREAGLEPLAQALFDDPSLSPETLAATYLNVEHKIETVKDALDGAKQILMERFSEDANLLGKLRDYLWQEGSLQSKLIDGKEREAEKFQDYFDYLELLNKVPSHRALAIFRGRHEGFLSAGIVAGLDADGQAPKIHPCEIMLSEHLSVDDQGRPADSWLKEVVRWTWRVKLLGHLETDLFNRLREDAEDAAIKVFAANLKDVLLAAPAGARCTMGLDPGLRTGVKVAIVDATGRVLDHCAIYPHPPQKKLAEAEATLSHLIQKHNVELIAIGNGTASRETDRLVADVIKANKDLRLSKVMISEAGASIYSASELASNEFPDLDVTIRGAISIARRLQDPLAELVKIDPKSIGVGQYQHDVNQTQLMRSLDSVVEDCVNAVGVDVNTASAALLARVSGLNATLANQIVIHRDSHGAYSKRQDLLKVSRFGDKTFEQAAGFLRIINGQEPLDSSAVHPESYPVVEAIALKNNRDIAGIIGDSRFIRDLKASDYISEQFGLPTIVDIVAELDKPGRDPRPEFKTAKLLDGIEKISDLELGMILEGTVSNVTNFGAFVDIGVHQDGLVHISALSESFVKDPREVVRAGQLVKVKVMEVDVARKRVALSMRLNDEPGQEKQETRSRSSKSKQANLKHKPTSAPAKTGTMGDLLKQALKTKS